MSATFITNKQLQEKLAQFPDNIKVATIWPGCYQEGEARVEGNLDGCDQLEVVKAHEVRSGWYYPPVQLRGYEDESYCHDVLVLSDVGVQWLEPYCHHYNKATTISSKDCVLCQKEKNNAAN